MLILPNVNKQYKHGNDNASEIKAFLQDNQECFAEELVGDLSHIHHRAASLSGVKIWDISHIGQNNYLLDFSFDWFAHVGCGHEVHEDTEHQCASFSIGESGEIKFNLAEVDARSTLEEF